MKLISFLILLTIANTFAKVTINNDSDFNTLPLGATAVIASPINISARIINSSNTLEFVDQGQLIINVDNFKIQGSIIAPLKRIFSGTKAVSFEGNIGIKEVYPQWWGADASDQNDDGLAIQSTFNCGIKENYSIPIKFPSGTYYVGNPLTIVNFAQQIEISGSNSIVTPLQSFPSNSALLDIRSYDTTGDSHRRGAPIKISGISFSGFTLNLSQISRDHGIDCISIFGAQNIFLDNVFCWFFNKGLHLRNTDIVAIDKSIFQCCNAGTVSEFSGCPSTSFRVINSSISNNNVGIQCAQGTHPIFQNNEFVCNSDAIQIANGPSDGQVAFAKIINNRFEGNTSSCIVFGWRGTFNCLIQNNNILAANNSTVFYNYQDNGSSIIKANDITPMDWGSPGEAKYFTFNGPGAAAGDPIFIDNTWVGQRLPVQGKYASFPVDTKSDLDSWKREASKSCVYPANINDNIGIGLKNPTARLQVIAQDGYSFSGSLLHLNQGFNNSTYDYARFSMGVGSGGLQKHAQLVAGSVDAIANNTPGFLDFYTNDYNNNLQNRMRIDQYGNVGIGTGTAAPGSRLNVSGNANISGTLNVGNTTLNSANVTGTCKAGNAAIGDYTSAPAKCLAVSGSVGIGTAPTTTGPKLEVAGQVKVTNGDLSVQTNKKVYLDGASNTYLIYTGSYIQLYKNGTKVAQW